MIRTFPYLEVTGTHRQVGEAIGEMFRGKIQETIEDRKRADAGYASATATISENLEITRRTFPKLVEELAGIAEGADVALSDYFYHNMASVVNEMDEPSREASETVDHCTVAVSFNDNGAIVGHNEDWAIESLDELYILKATIGDTTFLGLNYATFVPGVSATLNSHGLVQCINELPVLRTAGVPKNFIARAILECASLDAAEAVIRGAIHESGYNHVLLQGDEIRDIEVAGQEIDVQRILRTPYSHTNHYLCERMKQYESDTATHHENSRARLARTYELLTPGMDRAAMQALLSDTKHPTYPICRKDITIGSVIIEPDRRTMHVCYGMPTEGTYVPYSI